MKTTLYQPPPIKFEEEEEEENKDVAKFIRVYLGSEISEIDPGVFQLFKLIYAIVSLGARLSLSCDWELAEASEL